MSGGTSRAIVQLAVRCMRDFLQVGVYETRDIHQPLRLQGGFVYKAAIQCCITTAKAAIQCCIITAN